LRPNHRLEENRPVTWKRAARLAPAVTARRGAWALWAGAAALTAVAVGLYLLDVSVSTEDRDRLPLGALPAVVACVLACATVGALIASRLPRHPIGWLFSALGVTLAAVFALSGWADYALITKRGTAAGGDLAVWTLSWLFLVPLVTVPTLLFLLFPTGRPLSRGWGRLVWLATGAALVSLAGIAFRPGPIGYEPPVANPLGVGGAAGDALAFAATAGQVVAIVVLFCAALGMAVRFRRAHGEERLQLKWLAFAATLVAVTFPAAAGGPSEGLAADLLWLSALLAFMTLPLAAGVAILRHRLYDIDLVIRRTLIYGGLTAILAGVYLGLVLLSGLAVGDSDLAVAASTLAVAALFRPARARVQAAVDRRFYRRRYDAGQTLEAFGTRLRDELDLDALGADLRGVVRDTVQPAHVSLWLRSPR
jgi:hypothetical protein